ncbi:MAG: hypothetical protein R2713_00915 [Ilumatobacteraceae bacterium]
MSQLREDRCDVRLAETTPGGRALKFYSSVRLDIRRIESDQGRHRVTSSRTRVKVVKNKVAPPFKQAEFDIMYGKGISREGVAARHGGRHGDRQKSGVVHLRGDSSGRDARARRTTCREDPEVMMEVSDKVRRQAGLGDEFTEADDEPIGVELDS